MDFTNDEIKHSKRIETYKRRIKRIYNKTIDQIAKIAVGIKLKNGQTFSFNDYPLVKKQTDKILHEFSENVNTTIVNGVRSEWTYANNQNNEIFNLLFKERLTRELIEYNKIHSLQNLIALNSFLERKIAGMNLSQRVWNLTQSFQQELELALSLGIKKGKSAQNMSRDVRMYLNEPNKLFRRVRNEYGDLVLSKNAKAYHPGQGVYRSSYKNAIRLTANETNIAYRTANYNRWKNDDFVIGIQIELSNNHTLNGKPFYDMCDELQGRYPKDFKWVGWHVNCRCHAFPIMDEDNLFGFIEDKDYKPKGIITDVPDNFKKWIKENGERYANYKNVPYFITDNPKYIK